MSKRVLHISQFCEPEPTLKGLLFARELVSRGYDAEVVTGFPHSPSGKLYAGYKIKLIDREVIDGVLVTRLPLFISHSKSRLGRAANYISFGLSSLIYGLFFAKRPDIIQAYHPPLTVGISALIIKFFRRVPIVLDIQDMWPDTLSATGMITNPNLIGIISKVCNIVYRYVNQIVVLSPGFKNLLIDRGVPENKIRVIYNWADEKGIRGLDDERAKDIVDIEGFKILYAGNVGPAQGIGVILEAANLLKDSFPKVNFFIMGHGIELEDIKARAKELNLNNLHFLPAVATDKVGSFLESADALLVHLIANRLFEITIPGKTQAYMAKGKPMIMGVSGDAAKLVTSADCGVCIEPQNATSLANAAKKLMSLSKTELDNMGDNGKKFYKSKLSISAGMKFWSDVIDEVINAKTI